MYIFVVGHNKQWTDGLIMKLSLDTIGHADYLCIDPQLKNFHLTDSIDHRLKNFFF
jgi:hypothetical protein